MEKILLKINWIDCDENVNDGKEEEYEEIVECDSYKEATEELSRRDASQYNGHEIVSWVIYPKEFKV